MDPVKMNGRYCSRKLLLLIAVLTAFAAAFGVLGITAHAEGASYYATWDEYKDAHGITSPSWNDVATAEDELLEAAYRLYMNGDADESFKAARQAYYGYYETTGFERNVMGYISGSAVSKAELQFRAVRNIPKKGGTLDEYWAEITEMSEIIHDQANKLDGISADGVSGVSLERAQGLAEDTSVSTAASSGSTGTAAASDSGSAVSMENSGGNWGITFAACFGIILREGFEAILVVGAIIAYLVKSGNKDKLKIVYAGCVLAIIASFICAWLLNVLMFANTENQEIIEGITALIAVVVLFYVSNWMVSKAESDAWNKYIDSQVKVSAETGSVFTLGFTAFLAVFREGAEVILFYQPLANDPTTTSAMWAGFGIGCVVLVFVFLAIRFFSVKLPIRPFFLGTSILMFIMSISFLGAGIKELIEGDVISYTSPDWLAAIIPTNDVLDVLGIYACYETLIPQLILILITFLIFVMMGWKRNNRREAGVIAIVFGGLGMHKFYIGKYGQGILYAVFCWSFIPALLGVAEGVHYLSETDEEFAEELLPKSQRGKKRDRKQIKPAPEPVPAEGSVTAEAERLEASLAEGRPAERKPQNSGKPKQKQGQKKK